MSLNNRYNDNKSKSHGSMEGLGKDVHQRHPGHPMVKQTKKNTAKTGKK